MFSYQNKAHPQPSLPLMTVIIDTEEEFDWDVPFNRKSRSVDNISRQYLAQDIFKKHGIIPTYCIDYPVVENDEAVEVLKNMLDRGECLIGTHMHPWVSPPYDEQVTRFNSYAGNLPNELEQEKITQLTEYIEQRFGQRPVIFKAGRYGAGPNTGRILKELGYKVDCSVVSDTNFSFDFGPDFIGLPTQPYWFDVDGVKILELPNSRGYAGLLAKWGSFLYPKIAGSKGFRSVMAGVMVKSGLLERIPLTPEGIRADDHIRMVRRMSKFGQQFFNYAYHSSSLLVGGAPYVRSEEDLAIFLSDMDRFFAFFRDEMGGAFKTPLEMHSLMSKP